MPETSADKAYAFFPLLHESFDRINRREKNINAFISLCEEEAFNQARAIERLPGGASATLLKGRTVAIKDCIDVAGVPCTAGSAFFRNRVAEHDADCVTRLKAAGGVVIGKTNMHEFAYGGTTDNVHFGACHNPWNTDRIPGGSSGGSAAAVAAGFCDTALGTDTGSSVRMPAALCGISGLRPTCGLVPTDGCFPVSPYLDVIGPMGRTVQDLADLLTALTGQHPERSPYLRATAEPDLSGIRIGILEKGFFDHSDVWVADSVANAMAQLEAVGATLFEIRLPNAPACRDHVTMTIYRDAAVLHRQRMKEKPELFGKATLGRLQLGLEITDAEYLESRKKLREWEHEISRVFAEACDLILTPTVPVTAPPIADAGDLAARTNRLAHCCWPWAGARVPALTIPCGFDDGLPIGLQLAAAKGNEPCLLQAGAAYQATTDWHLHRPSLTDD